MNDGQMNLLEWHSPVNIIPFPLGKDGKRIRRTADVLSRKHGRDAESYWNRIVTTVGDRLLRAGVPAQRVDAELNDFREAVSQELSRLEMMRKGM